MFFQGGSAKEQAHAQALAAAVVLEDEGIAELFGGTDDMIPPNDSQRIRGRDAEGGESLILGDLADLKPECPAVVHDGASVPFQPSKDSSRIFGGITMIPRVRRGAHPVVEHTVRWRRAQVQHAPIQEPLLKWGS